MLSGMAVSVHVASRVVIQAPCAVTFPLEPGFVKFHYVEAGGAWLALEGERPMRIREGEWVLVLNGRQHRIGDSPEGPAMTVQEFTTSLQMPCMSGLNYVYGNGPLQLSMISGFAEIAQWRTHPIWRNLPDCIVVPAEGSEKLAVLLRQAAEEASQPMPGSRAIIDRLVEIAIMIAVRQHVERSGVLAASLFAPDVSRVLVEMHRRPDHPWTLEEMSRWAGMSRTTFVERFHRVVGRAPGEYLKTWRMHHAAQLLRDQRLSVGEAALAVGYGSEAAFARAFRREVGRSPGSYRKLAA